MSHRVLLVCSLVAFALGVALQSVVPFVHLAGAQGIVVDGHATSSDPTVPAGTHARLTYQGRLTNSSGAPINTTVNVVFKLYDSIPSLLWTSTTRSITPSNGLFTIYLGDGADPDLPLLQADSIGVTVGSDAEMTPRQALNSVVGHSENSVGVVGSSNSGYGMWGSSNSGYGVNGSSNTGYGVVGLTGDPNHAGVLAQNLNDSGVALEIASGGIKATGAGGGTNTFAFIHVASIANSTANWTRIDNTLTNGDQNAMLFVTHVNNPTGVASNIFNLAFGVYYDASSSRWTIYREDSAAIPVGATFNVMVIKR